MGSISYSEIKDAIARFIGTPEANWDSTTSASVESCIRTGIDRVVHCGGHQWTWMRPRYSTQTASGQRIYGLPSDFEQFTSDLCFDGVHYRYDPVTQKPAAHLLHLQSQSTTTGTPRYYATEPVAHDGVTGQGQQLVLHPTPDAAYRLIALYQVGVRPLCDARPYPPGGEAHGELFLASCLAVAESRFLDGPAARAAEYLEMLQAHIAIDLRRQARNLGSMSNKMMRMRGRADARRIFDLSSGYTTYNSGTDV